MIYHSQITHNTQTTNRNGRKEGREADGGAFFISINPNKFPR